MAHIDSRATIAALRTLAAESGQFVKVLGHEPAAAPSTDGVTCGVWVNSLAVVSSGLSAVSVRLELMARVFLSGLVEPRDDIDPRVLDAADALFFAIIGEFLLGLSDVRYVDVQGSDGEGLRAVPGWLTHDQKQYRTMDVFVPIIINDVYTYAA